MPRVAAAFGWSLPLACLVGLGAASVPAGDLAERWSGQPGDAEATVSFPSPIPVTPGKADRGAPIPLSPPNASRRGAQRGNESGAYGGPSWVTTIGSLAVVLGVFFAVAWLMRRMAPAGSAPLPGEVLEVLGRAAVAQRQQRLARQPR